MGTFHALCARVLRRDGAAIGIDPRFTIYDTDDQTGIVKQVLRDLELRGGTELRPAAVLCGHQPLEERPRQPARGRRAGPRLPRERSCARAYARYARAAARGLARSTSTTCSSRPCASSSRRPRCCPTTGAAGATCTSTSTRTPTGPSTCGSSSSPREHRNLAVVGDDDQSIYSWRGADLRNILDFEQDYPEATVVKLEQNYRSTQLILDAAHAVVERNEGRKDKKLWTQNPRGALIERFEADREDEEAEWVARQVEALVAGRGSAGSVLARRADDGDDDVYRLQDVAVMYRTNAQSRAIEEAFLRYGLRYQLVGGTRFYQRREVKDALAYLRLLRNDHDVAAFERVVNVPDARPRRALARGAPRAGGRRAAAMSGRPSGRQPRAPAS